MQKYKLVNNIFGWAAFIFAGVVYAMTMESSGSFWDCGEFVSGCFKLQVVHPPGAPWFLMLGRIFSLFTGADPLKDASAGAAHVAQSVNLMSALATAGAVMFTFWSVTALARKIVFKDGEYTTGRIITVIGAGAIAAACGTFLDSLWFSAVEGEVYATSQFFMSFIFWAIMKWDADDSKYADHWLVLIAYMTGISIGVHLLSLLALPALAIVYYYKRSKETTLSGWIIAAVVGFAILGFYMKFIISFTLSYLAGMDLLFVNSFGMPFNSGVIFAVLLLVAVLASIIRYTHTGEERDFNIALGISVFYLLISFFSDGAVAIIKVIFPVGLWVARKYGYDTRRMLNIGILAIAFSYIGYMSYLMVPIRSIANPPINMNRPQDPFTLKSYVDREQYGDRPLLYGPDYTCNQYYDIEKYDTTGQRWEKDEKLGKYRYAGAKMDYKIRDEVKMIFPRMGFWTEDAKKPGYRAWLEPEYDVVNYETKEIVKTFSPSQYKQATDYASSLNKKNGGGRPVYFAKDNISFGDNIRYFFKYQVGYMYFRYFFWNFIGRQNDIQGTYGNDDGRWISGIPFVDNSHSFFTPGLPQDHLPDSMLMNKGRNKFYMIPFIIGMIGMIYTFIKHERTFWVILVLFGTTGILQIIYQNEPPIEPRERDYAIASSFLTFTMWIGFGVLAIIEFLRKTVKLPEVPAAVGVTALCAVAPFLMGSQGWDDHSRHNRTTARDFAIDYLQSCAPNAVLFTQGDNDTYPLWYAQEVEGIRTDIRIINLSLIGVDWYIEQLRYKTNEAAPLKLSFKPEQYSGENRNMVRYIYNSGLGVPEGTATDLKSVMNFIASERPGDKWMYSNGESENYLPTRHFYIDFDPNKVREMKMLSPEDDSLMVSRMDWTIENGALMKNDLITLDVIANNIMDRPIYFAVSVSPDAYMGLEKYFQLEGLSYRVVPKVNATGSPYSAPPRTDVMYDNMMTKFKFGGIPEHPELNLDENILRMTVNIRGNYGRLAEALIAQGQKEKAAAAIDYSLKMLPAKQIPHSVFDYSYPGVYYAADQKDKGRKLLIEMMDKSKNELKYQQYVYEYTLDEARKGLDGNDQAQLNSLTNGKAYSSLDQYKYVVDELQKRDAISDAMVYYLQLQMGQYMERREVREELYIMQELMMTAKRYDDPDFASKVEADFNNYRLNVFADWPGKKIKIQ